MRESDRVCALSRKERSRDEQTASFSSERYCCILQGSHSHTYTRTQCNLLLLGTLLSSVRFSACKKQLVDLNFEHLFELFRRKSGPRATWEDRATMPPALRRAPYHAPAPGTGACSARRAAWACLPRSKHLLSTFLAWTRSTKRKEVREILILGVCGLGRWREHILILKKKILSNVTIYIPLTFITVAFLSIAV